MVVIVDHCSTPEQVLSDLVFNPPTFPVLIIMPNCGVSAVSAPVAEA